MVNYSLGGFCHYLLVHPVGSPQEESKVEKQ
jgi:hypothetical protein